MAGERSTWGRKGQGIVLLIVLIAAVAAILVSRSNDATTPAVNSGGAPPSLAAAIAEPARHWEQAVAGDARISEVVSDGAVYVDEMGKRVLVLLPPGVSGSSLRPGQKVRIEGVVRPSTQIGPEAMASMSSPALKEVKGDAAYVAASNIRALE